MRLPFSSIYLRVWRYAAAIAADLSLYMPGFLLPFLRFSSFMLRPTNRARTSRWMRAAAEGWRLDFFFLLFLLVVLLDVAGVFPLLVVLLDVVDSVRVPLRVVTIGSVISMTISKLKSD